MRAWSRVGIHVKPVNWWITQEEVQMAQVLVLTNLVGEVPLPALQLLNHDTSYHPLALRSALTHSTADLLIVDATTDLVAANRLCLELLAAEESRPVIVVMNDGGLAAITAAWGARDLMLNLAGPAEIEARIRLALEPQDARPSERIHSAHLAIDEASYSAKLSGKVLDLTFKEFELLKFLALHPSRVFTREQLLSEVWGYDYFGGTRTVDVHVRRLRAKLGEHEQMIGTVRNVGYRFAPVEETDNALHAQP